MIGAHFKYVLIGAGAASSAAAEAIRRIDHVGTLLLVGQEINRPYDRTALNKSYLSRDVSHDSLFTLSGDWFARNDVQLRTGRRVTRIDPPRHAIALDSGEEIAFDKLLIAVGVTPAVLNVPGAILPNVYSLRTFADAERLQNAIDKAKAEGRKHEHGRGRVAIIGAGWLGTELAVTLTRMGLHVDLISEGASPLVSVIGETSGGIVGKLLERQHVSVHARCRALRLEGDGRVQRVVLTIGQTLETDFVISAIGTMLNKDILRGTTIAAEKAILTDSRAQTSVPDIYAAGDCAAILDPLFGKHRQLTHVQHARFTGSLAGHNMAGESAEYDAVNWASTSIFDVPVNVWGESRFVQRRIVRGTPRVDQPEYVEIGIDASGAVCQVLAVGHVANAEALVGLVRRRVKINGNEERWKDPTHAIDLA